ncbi:hypothetical protein AAGK40_26355, partial [Klebsiella pneumoniae]
ADRNRSHWSTSKTPSYTKSVSWQHHLAKKASFLWIFFIYNQSVYFLSERKEGFHSQIQMPR